MCGQGYTERQLGLGCNSFDQPVLVQGGGQILPHDCTRGIALQRRGLRHYLNLVLIKLALLFNYSSLLLTQLCRSKL